jgi:hypothetical protein
MGATRQKQTTAPWADAPPAADIYANKRGAAEEYGLTWW